MIRKLPPHLIHQIAAGEIIERPSSALKELLENALDAGATKIQIEFEGGGLERLSVEDNGQGIGVSDFPLVFEAHATSKIERIEDFDRLRSFGFRGEALNALGQIAEVELESSTKDDSVGHQMKVRFGIQHPLEPIHKRIGTQVTLRRIFAQHPVRLKFIKSARSEAMSLGQVFRKYALAYPEVSFEFGEASKPSLKLKSESSLQRSLWYFESSQEEDWFEFKGSISEWSIKGVALKPTKLGSAKSQILVRLNRRPIRDLQLEFAVKRAFEGYTENTRDVAVSIDLEGDPKNFDVNVHPTKAEVRFRNSDGLFQLIVTSIRRELESSHRDKDAHFISAPVWTHLPPTVSSSASTPQFEVRAEKIETPKQLVFALPQESASAFKYLGCIDATFLVASRDQNLFLFDQHALHERIIYERLLHEFNEGQKIKSQRLLFPVNLKFEGCERLFDHEEALVRLGFEIRQWKDSGVSLLASPGLIKREPEKVLQKFVESIELPFETMAREVLSTMACHSAVRAHDILSENEIQKLFEDFNSQDALGHCPHGRPTFVRWGIRDLEKMFHRIL